jgi:hypothetical protein
MPARGKGVERRHFETRRGVIAMKRGLAGRVEEMARTLRKIGAMLSNRAGAVFSQTCVRKAKGEVLMEYLILATAGVVGGIYGYPNPDDDDSPSCPVCAIAIGIIASIIYYMVLRNVLGEDHSFLTLSLVGFFGGAAGAAVVGAGINMARGGRKSA